jgi:CheY-like chemotaxis protein
VVNHPPAERIPTAAPAPGDAEPRFDDITVLVVADIAMPDVDGYELMARLRRMNSGIPAIVVSAYVRPEDRDGAVAAGFRAYCPKPLDGPAFLRVATEVIARG